MIEFIIFAIGILLGVAVTYGKAYKSGVLNGYAESVYGLQRFMKWMSPIDSSYFKMLASEYNSETAQKQAAEEAKKNLKLL